MSRGWIGVDLDGTLAYYDTWRGETHIGTPLLDVVQRVRDVLSAGEYDVRIFTARVNGRPQLIPVIQDWLEREAGLPRLPVTCEKDYLCVEIWDDRAEQFIPNTGDTVARKFLRDIQEFCGLWCTRPGTCDSNCPLAKYEEV
jgi:hypothetical protein